jgi:hypothetical protein
MEVPLIYCHSNPSLDLSSNPTFWGIIISAILAVSSWFIIAFLNRRNEIFKLRLSERFKARQTMFNLYVEFQLSFNEALKKNDGKLNLENANPLTKKLENARPYFQLYGTDEEKVAIEEFISAYSNEANKSDEQRIEHFHQKWKQLTTVVFKSIRIEYGYED